MEEILARIFDVEAVISRKAMHQQSNYQKFEPPNDKIMPTTKYCFFCRSHTHNTKKPAKIQENRFCTFCKSKTHNTNDCYKKPKKSEPSKPRTTKTEDNNR
ncbi:hypothetical protein HZS_7446 [Henneguya salminicola]|nr:hypothetical protein HZS_7446 [Henneguya salminicola]